MKKTSLNNILKNAKKNCPVPIYYGSVYNFICKNENKFDAKYRKYLKKHKDDFISASGLFVTLSASESKKINKPRNFIILKKQKDKCKEVFFLFHETGHAICSMKKCKCLTSNVITAEYHAEKYALEQTLLFDNSKLINNATNYILCNSTEKNKHGSAARRVMKTKVWSKIAEKFLMDFIGGNILAE